VKRVPQLPDVMGKADHRAHEVDRAVVDMTGAWLLSERIGQTFQATVLAADEKSATVALDEPAVRARCTGSDLPIGQRVGVRLIEADTASRTVRSSSLAAPSPVRSLDSGRSGPTPARSASPYWAHGRSGTRPSRIGWGLPAST